MSMGTKYHFGRGKKEVELVKGEKIYISRARKFGMENPQKIMWLIFFELINGI